VPMAVAALQQVLAWGVERIQRALSSLTESVANLAAESGFSVLPSADRSAHMIGIRPLKGFLPELPKLLKEANVFVSTRGDSIRIAPHLYNDARDIDRFFEVLRQAGD
jgi:selenocysteine lyase/cysteine desulfurase